MFARLALTAALTLGTALPSLAQTRIAPPALQFLPPDLAPRDLCYQPKTDLPSLRDAPGRDSELTDRARIRFLTRDIRNYRKIDADRYFTFIDALITRRAQLDEEFAGVEETMERIELHLQAGRLQELTERGLVQALAADVASLNNTQSVQLAQYIRTGVGVPPDPQLAQTLIRAAAHEGNARADGDCPPCLAGRACRRLGCAAGPDGHHGLWRYAGRTDAGRLCAGRTHRTALSAR